MGAAKPARRFDPKSRPVDAVGDWTVLKNRDPERHYVGALEMNKGMFDVEWYLSLAEGLGQDEEFGYRVEKYAGEQGVRFRTGNTSRVVGDPIRFRGHILMSCPKEFKELLDQVGSDGGSGLRMADQIDEQIKRRGAYTDPASTVRGREGDTYVRPLSTQEMENRSWPTTRHCMDSAGSGAGQTS